MIRKFLYLATLLLATTSCGNSSDTELIDSLTGVWIQDSTEVSRISYGQAVEYTPILDIDNNDKCAVNYRFSYTVNVDESLSYTANGLINIPSTWKLHEGNAIYITPNFKKAKTTLNESNPITVRATNERDRQLIKKNLGEVRSQAIEAANKVILNNIPADIVLNNINVTQNSLSFSDSIGVTVNYSRQ
jgi:hypothetical protein